MHLSTRSLIVATLVALAGEATAYTIKTSSQGANLHWGEGEVVFAPVAAADVAQTSIAAIATWQAALVASASPVSIRMADAPGQAAPHVTDGINTIRWAEAADDPDLEMGILANTFVAYRTVDGEIQDADVVLDAVDFTWTTSLDGCGNEYDVQSAVTHELGHALGLAHAVGHPDATMYATGDACEVGKRDLDPDDTAAIAELYPAPVTGGCATSGSGGGLGLGLVAVGLAARRRRGRRALPMLALAVTFVRVGHVEAAQLQALDLATLGARAALVVRGHVVATAVTPDGPLETVATVVVDACLAGSCPSTPSPTVTTIEITRRGGERAGVGLWVDGEATLAVGADVILYLRVDPRGHLRVLGGVQGALAVERDHAVRDLRGHQRRVDGTWQPGTREVISLAALRGQLAVTR